MQVRIKLLSFITDGSHLDVAVLVTQARILTIALALLMFAGTAASAPQSGHPAQWEPRDGQKDFREPFQRPQEGKGLSERDMQDRLDFLGKMLTRNLNAADPGADLLFLNARASELIERAKQARTNSFQFDSLTGAVLQPAAGPAREYRWHARRIK